MHDFICKYAHSTHCHVPSILHFYNITLVYDLKYTEASFHMYVLTDSIRLQTRATYPAHTLHLCCIRGELLELQCTYIWRSLPGNLCTWAENTWPVVDTVNGCGYDGQKYTVFVTLQSSGIPYSSKFSWHNIFVNFVIWLLIMKTFFMKI